MSFLVSRIIIIPPNPLPAHPALSDRRIQLLPEVTVGTPLPAFSHTAKEVLAIGIYHHLRILRGLRDTFQSSGNLHTITGGLLNHARENTLLAILKDNGSPPPLA